MGRTREDLSRGRIGIRRSYASALHVSSEYMLFILAICFIKTICMPHKLMVWTSKSRLLLFTYILYRNPDVKFVAMHPIIDYCKSDRKLALELLDNALDWTGGSIFGERYLPGKSEVHNKNPIVYRNIPL